jgi:hypothetical protein
MPIPFYYDLDCGCLGSPEFDFHYSLRIWYPVSDSYIPLDKICFCIKEQEKILTAYNLVNPLIIYPNYYSLKLSCQSDIQYFTAWLQQITDAPKIVLTITRIDKTSGTSVILFKNTVDMHSIKPELDTMTFEFSVLESVRLLENSIFHSDSLLALIGSCHGDGIPIKKLLYTLAAIIFPDVDYTSFSFHNSIKGYFVDYENLIHEFDPLDGYFEQIDSYVSNSVDFLSTYKQFLYSLLYSFSSCLIYKSNAEILVAPLFYDGSERFELNYGHIISISNPFYVPLSYPQSIGIALNPGQGESIKYQYWQFRDFLQIQRYHYFDGTYAHSLKSNMISYFFPCDDEFDNYYDIIPGVHLPSGKPVRPNSKLFAKYNDSIHGTQLCRAVNNSFRIKNYNGAWKKDVFPPYYIHYDDYEEEDYSEDSNWSRSLWSHSMRAFEYLLKGRMCIKATLRGLNYPVEKFFTLESNMVTHKYYPNYKAIYRCLRYGYDIKDNTTELFLFPV